MASLLAILTSRSIKVRATTKTKMFRISPHQTCTDNLSRSSLTLNMAGLLRPGLHSLQVGYHSGIKAASGTIMLNKRPAELSGSHRYGKEAHQLPRPADQGITRAMAMQCRQVFHISKAMMKTSAHIMAMSKLKRRKDLEWAQCLLPASAVQQWVLSLRMRWMIVTMASDLLWKSDHHRKAQY
jgi:hypothetical protein